jgi:hypothetical protein
MPKPIVRISKQCWAVWLRYDQPGLEEFMKTVTLIVRVPVDRQRRGEPTVG